MKLGEQESPLLNKLQNFFQLLKARGCDVGQQPGASEEDLRRGEQRLGVSLSEELRTVYRLTNGTQGSVLFGAPLLPLERAAEISDGILLDMSGMSPQDNYGPLYSSEPPDLMQDAYWVAGWVPLLEDHTDYLCVDLVPGPKGQVGQIVSCGRNERHEVIFPDLESLIDALWLAVEQGTVQVNRDGLEVPGAINHIMAAKQVATFIPH